jgi:hypothetical protein
MLQEAYGKKAMKKTEVNKWHERFCDICVSMTVCSAGNRQLQQMTKKSNLCSVLHEMTGKRVLRRYQQK